MTKRGAVIFTLLACASTALAHTAATGIVKERMDGMIVLRKSMKTVLAETQSTTPNIQAIKTAAQAMQAHAGEAMTGLFPDGSLDHPSEAKATIWQDWERFSYLANQLDLHAQGLALAASNPITGKPAEQRDNRVLMDFATMGPDEVFTLIGKTCTACHEQFRVKKKAQFVNCMQGPRF